TVSGGTGGYGTVFEVAAATHALTTLVTFDNTNGARPYAGLIADAAGNLYGTTIDGGAFSRGTVFKVSAGTHALTTLATFNLTNGANPYAGLIADAAGNLYGAAYQGGPSNQGTVFELSGTGFVTSAAVPLPSSLVAGLVGFAALPLVCRRRARA